MPKIVTFTLTKGTNKREVNYNLPTNWDSISDSQKTAIMNQKRDALAKQDSSKTFTIGSGVISDSSVKLKEAKEPKESSTVYLNNKKTDKDAQKAYIEMMKQFNKPPEFEVIPSYYQQAKDNMTINDVRYPNTDLDVEEPTENEFGIEKQESFVEPPKDITDKPKPEEFGYDNVFMRKGFEGKARTAYLNVVNKRIDKNIEKPLNKEKAFDAVIKKYKKVVKESSDITKIYEDSKHLVMSPLTIKSIPGFIKEYGKGTSWINENVKTGMSNKVFVVIDKTKDILSDVNSKLLVLTNENKIVAINATGKNVSLEKLGIDYTMFDSGTKSLVEDASAGEETILYSKNGIKVIAPSTLNAIMQHATTARSAFGRDVWRAPIRDAIIKDKKTYIVLDANAEEQDPFSHAFVSVSKEGKIDAFDAKNAQIDAFDSFLDDKGISKSYFKPSARTQTVIESHEDLAQELKSLDYDAEGMKIIVKIHPSHADGKEVLTIICFAGNDQESYLRDLLKQVGYKNGDSAKLTHIEAENADSYDIYEFCGLER